MSKYEYDPFYDKKYYVWKSLIFDDTINEWKYKSPKSVEIVQEFLNEVCRKHPQNEYLVVNQDEPYADEVWDLIKRNNKPQIIAFTGRAGSGKDYQCNLLVEKGFKKLAFADALRDIAYKSLCIDFDALNVDYDWLKKYDCIHVSDKDGEEISFNFRTFLEKMGTQGIRAYDNDFWARCVVNTIKKNSYKRVCVSDLRFVNEYNMLSEFAKENNYTFKCIFCDYKSDRYQDNNTHESAVLSNYLATHGYTDLQEIHDWDIQRYLEVMNEKVYC